MSDPSEHQPAGFDNRAFWDTRYRDNAELGSGVGSRGRNLVHKREVIERFLTRLRPTSVLDVGCGDHEVLKSVAVPAEYRGIDISSVVVDRNTRAFPERRFELADFVDDPRRGGFEAEAVLCLEVLIHQHVRQEYDRLVRNLVDAAGRGGLVSGYVSDPRPTVSSSIIAWHEPITDTLVTSGAKRVEIEARSLESDCLAFVSFTT